MYLESGGFVPLLNSLFALPKGKDLVRDVLLGLAHADCSATDVHGIPISGIIDVVGINLSIIPHGTLQLK